MVRMRTVPRPRAMFVCNNHTGCRGGVMCSCCVLFSVHYVCVYGDGFDAILFVK